MIVRDTVGLVVLAHNEGGALQGTGTDHTGEALWVVGFASGPQHAVSDRLPTGVALLQGLLGKNRAGCEGTRVSKAHPAPPQPEAPAQTYGIAALAIGRPFQTVELPSLQLLLALMASEAGDVEKLSQCANCRLGAGQWLTASATGLWEDQKVSPQQKGQKIPRALGSSCPVNT